MKLDSAVTKLLGLDAEETAVSSAGGGGCSAASTFKIQSKNHDGKEQTFFLKTARGKEAKVMFEGEYASLTAIHNAVPSLCPQSFGHGQFSFQPQTYFLVTDFLNLTSRSGSSSKSKSASSSLAAKLAKLHTTPAPIPDGYEKPMFGFPVTTCCGDTAQDNSFKDDWAEFYAENRLMAILKESERKNSKDNELRALVETTASIVTPRLLGATHLNHGRGITPVVVHGDLWSGNASFGSLGTSAPEEVIFDSSACYAHSEYELGIMNMFGGFGTEFLKEYHEKCPKTEPLEEYEDRMRLYELYHHLNHYALFGGGYRGGAVGIMRELVRKHGK